MDDLSIAVAAGASALALLAILVALFWRSLSGGSGQTNQPHIDDLMRQALRRPPLQPRGLVKPVSPARPPVVELAETDIPPAEANNPDERVNDGPLEPPVPDLALQDTAPSLEPDITEPEIPATNGSRNEAEIVAADSGDPEPSGAERPQAVSTLSNDGVQDDADHASDYVPPDFQEPYSREPAGPIAAPEPDLEISSLRTQESEALGGCDLPPEDLATEIQQPGKEDRAEEQPTTPPPVQVEEAPRLRRRSARAVFKDRRGQKRRVQPTDGSLAGQIREASAVARIPAEARLRLALHPIHQTARLSLVLSRPEGFPERSAIDLGKRIEFEAFDKSRYDDIDMDWLPETLEGELRFVGLDGFSWLRSARRFHIFSTDPAEPGVVSVSSVKIGADYTILCKQADTEAVAEIAAATGSPELARHNGWQGIPAGWCVLSGYVPKRAAVDIADGSFRPLDPGFDIEIRLSGGLTLRPSVFAEGHAPRIEIPNLPEGVSVTIDSKSAWLSSSSAWEAEGWNSIGTHLIDLVPGPSLTYEIFADPGNLSGWPQWDAHEGRFDGGGPWARTWICGASICGSNGETVIAHEARPTVVSLGSRDYATMLVPRPDVGVCVGLAAAPPAFLLVSSGPRRHQGEVLWLGLERAHSIASRASSSVVFWANIVRSAVARRLPLRTEGSAGAKEVWRNASRRARALKRRRA